MSGATGSAVSGSDSDPEGDRHPLFVPAIFVGGLVFGVGLAVSGMAQPEIVLDFLQLQDLGLVFVMGGAAAVFGPTVWYLSGTGRTAPLTGRGYARRLKSMDRNVVLGGGIFGVGWGLSGICPGAAYASLGIGNVAILWGVAGMFLGAYLQGWVRSATDEVDTVAAAD